MGKVIKLKQNNTQKGKIRDKYRGGGYEILLPTHVLSFRRKRKVEERRRRRRKEEEKPILANPTVRFSIRAWIRDHDGE